MLETLLDIDKQLFILINSAHHPWVDTLMYLVSTKTFWIPAYAILLWFMYKQKGLVPTLWLLVGVAIAITIADQFTSSFMKPFFERFRPCRPENNWDYLVHLVNNKCGGKYGFASSHAANFFALATLMSQVFQKSRLSWGFFGVAALVAYSRVYLGVHFPGDVLVGGIVGICAGFIGYGLAQVAIRQSSTSQ
ncbi:MAG: phosphatase PAP2 family protein [Bacteroidota bacterium]